MRMSGFILKAATFFSLSAICLTACQKDREKELPAPVLNVQDTVLIGQEGGAATVTYSIDHQNGTSELSARCDAEWIHDLDYSEPGTVSMTADSNSDTASRETVLELTYGDIQKHVMIIQDGLAIAEDDFSLEFKEIGYTTITVSISPRDKEMTYVALITQTDVFSQFNNDDDVIEFAMREWTNSAESMGVSMTEYLASILISGDLEGDFTYRYPDTGYTIFVFGITSDAEVLTKVHSWDATTEAPEKKDIEYTITSTVNGADATLHVVPSDQEQSYYVNVFETSTLDSQEGDVTSSVFWQAYIVDMIHLYSIVYGTGIEDVVTPFLHTGEDDASFSLSEKTSYTALAMAMSEDGLVLSDVSSAEFQTGSVVRSDNKITINAWMNAEDDLWFDILTTNDDPYTWGVQPSSTYAGMDDEEMLEYLLNDFLTGLNIQNGYLPGGCGVTPGETYTIWAFGYQNGAATTDLVHVSILAAEGETASSEDSGTSTSMISADKPSPDPAKTAQFKTLASITIR